MFLSGGGRGRIRETKAKGGAAVQGGGARKSCAHSIVQGIPMSLINESPLHCTKVIRTIFCAAPAPCRRPALGFCLTNPHWFVGYFVFHILCFIFCASYFVLCIFCFVFSALHFLLCITCFVFPASYFLLHISYFIFCVWYSIACGGISV